MSSYWKCRNVAKDLSVSLIPLSQGRVLCPRFEPGRRANNMAIYATAHMATLKLTWLCHTLNGYVKNCTKINFYSTLCIIWHTSVRNLMYESSEKPWIYMDILAIGGGQLVMYFTDSWRINQGPNIYLDPWRVPPFSLCDWQKTWRRRFIVLYRTDQATQHSPELVNRLSKENTSCGLAQQIFSS